MTAFNTPLAFIKMRGYRFFCGRRHPLPSRGRWERAQGGRQSRGERGTSAIAHRQARGPQLVPLHILSLMDATRRKGKGKKGGKEGRPDYFKGKATLHKPGAKRLRGSPRQVRGIYCKFMLPALARGGAQTSCNISLCWGPEDPGKKKKMGSPFLSEDKAAVSRPLRGPRARGLPAGGGAGRGEGARGPRLGQPLPRAPRRGHRHARAAHAALPGSRTHAAASKASPVLPRTPGSCGPRGVKLSALQPGCCSQKGKRCPLPPARPTAAPTARPLFPGTLGHHGGRPPKKDLALEGSGEDRGRRGWRRRGGFQAAATGEGLEKWSKRGESRVGAP